MNKYTAQMANSKRLAAVFSALCVLYICCLSFLQFHLQSVQIWQNAKDAFPLNFGNIVSQISKYKNRTSSPHINSTTNQPLSPNNGRRSKMDATTTKDYYENGTFLIYKARAYLETTTKSTGSHPVMLRLPGDQPWHLHQNPVLNSTQNENRISQQDQSIPAQTSVQFLPLSSNMYVYGAFLDGRNDSDMYARLFVLQSQMNKSIRLVCQMYMQNGSCVTATAETYEMCENHGKKYGGWIYSCPIPCIRTDIVMSLTLLSLSDTVLTTLSSIYLHKIQAPLPENYLYQKPTGSRSNKIFTHNINISEKLPNPKAANDIDTIRLGVCVPPLYGEIFLFKLINFLELCHILGADKIFLYIQDISKDILSFLKHYSQSKSKLLSLIEWYPPISREPQISTSASEQLIWNHGQLLAVQHCLYTNMANYNWLLFLDIDEMLVPQRTLNWPQLIRQLANQFSQEFSESVAAISFESAFFEQDFQSQITNSIHYFQYLYRTKNTSTLRSKLLVRPQKVFEMGIHHISKTVSDKDKVIKASSTLGLIHHYRKCQRNDDIQCEIVVRDETILRFEKLLTTVSQSRMQDALTYFANQGNMNNIMITNKL